MENLNAREVEIEEERVMTMFEYMIDLKAILRAGRAYIARLSLWHIRHTDPGAISTKRAAAEAMAKSNGSIGWRNNALTPLPNSGAPSLQRADITMHNALLEEYELAACVTAPIDPDGCTKSSKLQSLDSSRIMED